MRIQPHKICGFVGIYFNSGGSKGFGRLQPEAHRGCAAFYITFGNVGNVLWIPVITIDSRRGRAYIAVHTRACSLRLQGERDL